MKSSEDREALDEATRSSYKQEWVSAGAITSQLCQKLQKWSGRRATTSFFHNEKTHQRRARLDTRERKRTQYYLRFKLCRLPEFWVKGAGQVGSGSSSAPSAALISGNGCQRFGKPALWAHSFGKVELALSHTTTSSIGPSATSDVPPAVSQLFSCRVVLERDIQGPCV